MGWMFRQARNDSRCIVRLRPGPRPTKKHTHLLPYESILVENRAWFAMLPCRRADENALGFNHGLDVQTSVHEQLFIVRLLPDRSLEAVYCLLPHCRLGAKPTLLMSQAIREIKIM